VVAQTGASHGNMPANHILTTLVTDIRGKLEETLGIVKAAETCALNGSANRSVQVLMTSKA
jgi:hypothetical protein